MTHEHLNDAELSAHLDGEPVDGAPAAGVPAGAVAVEIAACAKCRARLAALAGARGLVFRRPVPPPSRRRCGPRRWRRPWPKVSGPSRTPVRHLVLSRRTKRPSWSTGVAIGAAAAVVLVAVGISVGLSHTHAPPAALSALSRTPHRPAALAPAPTGATATALPDLGSIGSTKALRSKLASVPGLGPSDDQSRANGSTAATAAPSSTNLAPGSFSSSGSPVASTESASSPCVAAAPAEVGTIGTPTLVATVTYGHTPALVVVIDATDSSSTTPSSRLVVVLARSGCRVLARTTV